LQNKTVTAVTAARFLSSYFQVALGSAAKKVPLFFYTLYLEGERSGGPGGGGEAEGEAIVRVSVLDVNDNVPEFLSPELMAAVPITAEYGQYITKLEVRFL
jgi:hypothetical protein